MKRLPLLVELSFFLMISIVLCPVSAESHLTSSQVEEWNAFTNSIQEESSCPDCGHSGSICDQLYREFYPEPITLKKFSSSNPPTFSEYRTEYSDALKIISANKEAISLIHNTCTQMGGGGINMVTRSSPPVFKDPDNEKIKQAIKYSDEGKELFKLGKYREALELFYKANELVPHSYDNTIAVLKKGIEEQENQEGNADTTTEDEQDKPTRENPLMTESLEDESPNMLLARVIFSEASGEPNEVKQAVAWVIKNNKGDKTYNDVILTPRKFSGFNYYTLTDNKKTDYEKSDEGRASLEKAFERVKDPLKNKGDETSWYDSYDIAQGVFSNNPDYPDITHGAKNFCNCQDIKKDKPTKYNKWARDLCASYNGLQIGKLTFG